MRKVKIITDSCADLTGELLDKYDIDYVKNINFISDCKIIVSTFLKVISRDDIQEDTQQPYPRR